MITGWKTNWKEFEDYFSEYKHWTLILNIKEACIENKVIEIVKQA